MSLIPITVLWALAALGQAPGDNSTDERDRDERTRFFKEKSAELSLFRLPDTKQSLPFVDRPVLRYSNPVGLSGDGATFLWLAGTRPAAVVSFSIRRPNNAVYRECTSLWSQPLDCRQNGASIWSPKTGGLLEQRLADAPAPAMNEARRLSQMRDICKRFGATWHHSRTNERTELNILPTPIYRFTSESDGILDGALFAFVITNDPEMLLLQEAIRDKPDAAAYWRYSLARMSSLKEVVRLGDQEVWSVPHFYSDPNDDRLTGPYSEQRVGTFASKTNAADRD
jgi:hypothetical protein